MCLFRLNLDIVLRSALVKISPLFICGSKVNTTNECTIWVYSNHRNPPNAKASALPKGSLKLWCETSLGPQSLGKIARRSPFFTFSKKKYFYRDGGRAPRTSKADMTLSQTCGPDIWWFHKQRWKRTAGSKVKMWWHNVPMSDSSVEN